MGKNVASEEPDQLRYGGLLPIDIFLIGKATLKGMHFKWNILTTHASWTKFDRNRKC